MSETKATGAAANKQLIGMLLRSRLFRDYENVFTKATGLPLALRPLEYWQLEHHDKTNENRFCALLSQRPATLAVCLQSHADIVQHTGVNARTETCPFGLTETAVPVRLGQETIGFLRIGQVLRRSAIQSDKTRAAAKLKREIEIRMQAHIQQTLTGIPVVQAFVQEEREHQRFQQFADAAIAAQQRSTLIGSLNSLSSGLVTVLGTGGILWLGARHVHDRLPAEIRERLPEELRVKITGS